MTNQTKTMAIFSRSFCLTIPLLLAVGCVEPEPDGVVPGEEGKLIFANDAGPRALAVGATFHTNVRPSSNSEGSIRSIEAVEIEDEALFELVEIDAPDLAFTLRALDAGTSRVSVEALNEHHELLRDHFELTAREPDRVALNIGECEDTTTLMTSQDYSAALILTESASAGALIGTGLVPPIYTEPAAALSWSDEILGFDRIDLTTGETAQTIAVHSEFDAALIQELTIVAPSAVDEIQLNFAIVDPETRSEPFEAHWDVGEVNLIYGTLFTGGDRICVYAPTLRIEVQTENNCEVLPESHLGTNFAKIKAIAEGTCILEVEHLDSGFTQTFETQVR